MNRFYRHFIIISLTIFLTLSGSSAFVFGDDTIGDAWDAYIQGYYKKAYKIAKNHTEHARGQYLLGFMYEKGLSVTKDNVEAVRWYMKSAEQGFASAQYKLGFMYAGGLGMTKDDAEAMRWYMKSAEQGNADAQRFLESMCKDAEAGDANGQFGLGLIYAKGLGVTKDEAEAVQWFRKAADQGNAAAQFNLGIAYENGQGVTKDEGEAVRWYRKAAEQGDAGAMVALGDCYLLGQGIEQNIATAQSFYVKAAELGYDDAQKKMRITAMRGYLRSPLNVRSDSGNIIVGRNEYVIFLPENKRLLHPHKGAFIQMPDVAEGTKATIKTEAKKSGGTAEVHIMFKTDFLIKKLLLDGASIPFDSIEASDAPEFIKSRASFSVSNRQLGDGFAMTLISRENAEHVRRLEYRDGTLKVISSRDLSDF